MVNFLALTLIILFTFFLNILHMFYQHNFPFFLMWITPLIIINMCEYFLKYGLNASIGIF